MKVYICDICGKQVTSKTAIGLYGYGKTGWTLRRMDTARAEAEDDKHVCALACLTKFFAKWLGVDGEAG